MVTEIDVTSAPRRRWSTKNAANRPKTAPDAPAPSSVDGPSR